MGGQTVQSSVWELVRRQHGVISRVQLLELGFTRHGIEHRKAKGRLHPVRRGVFAVGRPQVTRYGEWVAAVLAGGPGAVLSHHSAAALWRIRPDVAGEIHLSAPGPRRPTGPGLVAHRRQDIDATTHLGIPVTTPAATLIDLATTITEDQLEAAVNEADKRDLTTPDRLRSTLDELVPRPGTARLREILDRATFTFTDSALERRFLKIVHAAGLPKPETQARVSGYRVDFYWPDLKLVVETDGLRYHRTPAQQARDRLRDQTHTAAGLAVLRFTHSQVREEADRVASVLRCAA